MTVFLCSESCTLCFAGLLSITGLLRYSKEWEKTVKRIGRWIDFDNDYKTLDPNFMESVWWVFSTLHKKGLVYQGFKVSLASYKSDL